MTTAYSSLLGLALPVQGELAGQWGDTVNDYITKYLDASIAGSLSITADVTLTKTTGTTLGATSSQYAILTCSPASVNIVVTAPAAYKIYVVNNTSASYTVTIRGAGPTTGVVLAALEKAVVAWNGSDFFKVATSATDGVSTFSAGSTGLTPSSATAGAVTLAGTLAVANGGTGLTAGTSGGVLAYTATGTLASSSALAASALVIGGGAGAAPSTTTTGTGVVTALGVNTGTAGAFVVNGGALGTPSSGTVTNLTGTASININGTVGATTPAAGSFTTLSASGDTTLRQINITNSAADVADIFVSPSTHDLFVEYPTGYNLKIRDVAGTLSGIFSSTGLNSTVIGATTPAAGSFTTLSSTAAPLFATTQAAGNGATFGNTSAATLSYVFTAATGANSGPYHAFKRGTVDAGYIGSDAALNASGDNNDLVVMATGDLYLAAKSGGGSYVKSVKVTSTGLAVTGALSATGTATFSGGTATINNLVNTVGQAATLSLTTYNTNFGSSDTLQLLTTLGNTTTGESTSTFKQFNHNSGSDDVFITKTSGNAGYFAISTGTGAAEVARFTTTGLAVTGTLSASGNVAVGVTAGSWYAGSSAKAIEVGNAGSGILAYTEYANFTKNAYLNGSAQWVYGSSVAASVYSQNVTQHLWRSAAAGTAGNAITWTPVLAVDIGNSLALEGATSQTGTGITFPATQNASSNANTLDDYEEGTWTPTIVGNSGGTNTYTSQSGTYTKVGNVVTITGAAVLASISGNTGVVTVGGIPFVCKTGADGQLGEVNWSDMGTAYMVLNGYINTAGTRVVIYGRATATTTASDFIPVSSLAATTSLAVQQTYLTN